MKTLLTLIAILLMTSTVHADQIITVDNLRTGYNSGDAGQAAAIMFVVGLSNMYVIMQYDTYPGEGIRGTIDQCVGMHTPISLIEAILRDPVVSGESNVAHVYTIMQDHCHRKLFALGIGPQE